MLSLDEIVCYKTSSQRRGGVRIVACTGVILLTSKNRFRGRRRDIHTITREYGGGGGFFSGETGGEETTTEG